MIEMERILQKASKGLRFLERYTKTDMVYLAKNSFWMNSNTVITSGFSFILSIAFAHLVSKETYGVYQFLISISSIIGGLTLIGMNSAVTQAVARGFEGVLRESVKVQLKFGLLSSARATHGRTLSSPPSCARTAPMSGKNWSRCCSWSARSHGSEESLSASPCTRRSQAFL